MLRTWMPPRRAVALGTLACIVSASIAMWNAGSVGIGSHGDFFHEQPEVDTTAQSPSPDNGKSEVVAPVAVSPIMTPRAATQTSSVGAKTARTAAGGVRKPVQLIAENIQLCQALGPAAPFPIWGVDSTAGCCGEAEVGWDARGPIPWQRYAQGEYVGDARLAHVGEYRLRVDDQLSVLYRLTREETFAPYRLEVGDQIQVESLTGDTANVGGGPGANQAAGATDNVRRNLIVQPDGTITLPLLGQVRAAGLTIAGLTANLEKAFQKYYRVPAITVTPLRVNTRLEDLRAAVDARGGIGGQRIDLVVTPAGTISLPAIGAVCVQGLTAEEAKLEIDARYDQTIPGMDVTVILLQRAPRFIYVLGEVAQPGRFQLEGPTTVMGAIALAQGWNIGANMRQVVVFRRGHDWRLKATMLDVRGALYGRRPVPADEIWLNDSDIVVVPKMPIQAVNEFIELVFVRGLYSIFPQFTGGDFTFSSFSRISR